MVESAMERIEAMQENYVLLKQLETLNPTSGCCIIERITAFV